MSGSFSGVIAKENGSSIDLDIIQGDTIDFTIYLEDSTESTAAPLSLAGKSARAQFRKSNSGTVVLDFSSTNNAASDSTASAITINSTAGTLRLQKRATRTVTLKEKDYGVWDIKLKTTASGEIHTIGGGGFRVIPTSTRP